MKFSLPDMLLLYFPCQKYYATSMEAKFRWKLFSEIFPNFHRQSQLSHPICPPPALDASLEMFHSTLWYIFSFVSWTRLWALSGSKPFYSSLYLQSLTLHLFFFSTMVDYRIVNIVPCAIQYDLVGYLLCLNLTVSNSQPKSLSLHHHKSGLCGYESVSALQIGSFVSYFRFHT